jgi:hypothetical protein
VTPGLTLKHLSIRKCSLASLTAFGVIDAISLDESHKLPKKLLWFSCAIGIKRFRRHRVMLLFFCSLPRLPKISGELKKLICIE